MSVRADVCLTQSKNQENWDKQELSATCQLLVYSDNLLGGNINTIKINIEDFSDAYKVSLDANTEKTTYMNVSS